MKYVGVMEEATEQEILLNNVTWVSQFDESLFGNETCWQNSCCNLAANKILENSGASTNRNQQIIISQSSSLDCSDLTGKPSEFESAIRIIDKSIFEHKLPIMIGVQHPYYQQNKWENKCSGNIPNITNHYIVIVGKKYDSSQKQYYYLFYDVGTSNLNDGKNSGNRLYINHSSNLIKGKTTYMTQYSGDYYMVTEVRKNIGQIY
jgi:hypothetical protein